jgi:hypothetical protein
MIVNENNSPTTAPSALTQGERDEIDNRSVRDAWKSLVGGVPFPAEQQVERGEVFYSALDLAEIVVGPTRLAGWRVSFTSEGGPYAATLIVRDPSSNLPSEFTATHPRSLTLALTSVVSAWAEKDDAYRGSRTPRVREPGSSA